MNNELSYEEWVEAGDELQFMYSSIYWWLGAWLNEGERRYGEKYVQGINLTGNALENLKKFKYVEDRVKESTRHPSLSWTHHYYVCHLTEEEQVEWLHHAEKNELSSREFKKALDNAGASKKTAHKVKIDWMVE